MRKLFGGIVLAAGVAGLGYWGAKDHAFNMESTIAERANNAVAGAVHSVETEINGRDISIRGLADSEAERDTLIAALNAVEGRRVVTDALDILPVANPFTIAASRKDGQTLLQGNVPTEAMRAALVQSGAAGVEGLTMASGAPERWEGAIGAGLATLSKMDEGAVSLTGQTMRLTGLLDTPADRDTLIAGLSLPDGYTLENDIETRDDGKPVAFDVTYNIAEGVSVDGKLPKGLEQAQIADALGIASVSGETTSGIAGEPSGALAMLAKLKEWLPELETAHVSINENGMSLGAMTGAGVNTALVSAGLEKDLGTDVKLDIRASSLRPNSGATRVNAATGQTERFEYGAWLPKIDFAPSLSTCGAQSDKVLANAKINFLSGSADLGPRSLRAINAMASVFGLCVRDAGLFVEIGGHTDNTGSGNYELSAIRAQAVMDAMAARGVTREHMTAIGFGASKPIADNATDAGRAANRRTTLRWAQQ